MERTKQSEPLSVQMKRKVNNPTAKKKKEYRGNFTSVISTGSTLLDLAISGGRIRGGGLPGGILVIIFGPSAAGKTVLLCEIAGNVQREGGDARFDDPEARIDEQFARMFDMDLPKENYFRPDMVPQVFKSIREWKPQSKKRGAINGSFTDSLAALSTYLEMENDEGDKMGSRRSKEFSEGFRKTCRLIKNKNYLMVCSNQVRDVIGATPYQEKTKDPGGKALEFYPSLKLKLSNPKKIRMDKTIAGKKRTRVIGIETTIDVYKSSIWKPYHTAPITILFDYGIDDIRANLEFIKDYTGSKVYTIGGESLSKELEKSIRMIERDNLENELREEVIDLWEEVESKFDSNRKPKRR